MLSGRLEQLLDRLAGSPVRLGPRAVFGGEGEQFLERHRRVHRSADRLLDEIDHPGATPRGGEIVLLAVDRHDRGAGGRRRSVADEGFGEIHDLPVVDEGPVRLEHRELRIVPGGDALVAEDPADLVHPLHPADDEPLEVQLERDAEIERHVERVVVGDERAGVGAAGLGVQDRCLDFDEAHLVQGVAEGLDDRVADLEVAAGLGVDDEVGVALAETRVGVGEAPPLVGQRPDRLGQQLEPLDLDRELALAGRHHGAVGTDPVTEIELAEALELGVPDDRLGDEQLDLARAVAHRREDQLSLFTDEHQPTGDGDGRVGLCSGIEGSVLAANLGQRGAAVESVGVRIRARFTQLVDLGEPLGPLGGEATPTQQ